MDKPRYGSVDEDLQNRVAHTRDTIRMSRLIIAKSWNRIERTERELRKVSDRIGKSFDQTSPQ